MNQYRTNKTKVELQRGGMMLVPEINRVFDPILVEAVAAAGCSCVWIDLEHSHADLVALSNMILAARSVDLDVFVRIPHGPYNQVMKPLELGASGLIWPHCKSVEEARELVQMAKFRPEGMRGMGGGRDSEWGTLDRSAYFDAANENVLLGVMIEDAEAVDDCEAIAGVPGIDLLFIGPGDLSQSYGVHRDPGHPIAQPQVAQAFDRVGQACAANGKTMGTAVNPGESMRWAVEHGARWLNFCHDMTALAQGYGGAMGKTAEILSAVARGPELA